MRRTKATLFYRRIQSLRAVQLLLGHSKPESTVRDLGIEVDDDESRATDPHKHPHSSGRARSATGSCLL
jgi:hypothetical protein